MLEWHIGDVVRKLREARRWNQTKLADEAGLNKATIVRVEENGNSKKETILAVAKALGMTPGQLWNLIPGQEPERATAEMPTQALPVAAAGGDFHKSPKSDEPAPSGTKRPAKKAAGRSS
jgi:transcriptional regulator with XRE-family HTH domain